MMRDFERWMLTPKFKVNVIRCNDDVAIQVVYGHLKEPTECVNTCFMFTNDPDVLSEALESTMNSLIRSFNFPTSIKEFQNAISKGKESE